MENLKNHVNEAVETSAQSNLEEVVNDLKDECTRLFDRYSRFRSRRNEPEVKNNKFYVVFYNGIPMMGSPITAALFFSRKHAEEEIEDLLYDVSSVYRSRSEKSGVSKYLKQAQEQIKNEFKIVEVDINKLIR